MNFAQKALYFLGQHPINWLFLRKEPLDSVFCTKTKAPLVFVTVAFNNPYVLDLQLQLAKKYITDEFCHVVLDNSSNMPTRICNKNICALYDVTWVSLPHNPWTGIHNSRSHGISVNWGIRHILRKFSFDVVGFLDHDIYPIREHSVLAQMGSKPLMGLLQTRAQYWYLWPGFLFMRSSIVNTHTITMLPTRTTDTGGGLWSSLYRSLDNAKVSWIDEIEENFREGNSRQDSFYYCLGDWVHTVNASYWKNCSPKEHAILDILRAKTMCTTLAPSDIAIQGSVNSCA